MQSIIIDNPAKYAKKKYLKTIATISAQHSN